MYGRTVFLYEGQLYSKQGASGKMLYCSKKYKGCPAKVKLAADGAIVGLIDEHDHPKPIIRSYDQITLNGRKVTLFRNHTFSQQGPSFKNLYCSKRLSLHCSAKLKLDNNRKIVLANTNHNHPPMKFYKTSDGRYFKIQD
ncbi:hypothetical protein ABMA28_001411 [Loxostege sticticalis]|uniref:Modifier of mdg4 n=1 Tax=Loxostege sticticalis TaxID=481309 RepID=A0ABD0T2X9_LOXSC